MVGLLLFCSFLSANLPEFRHYVVLRRLNWDIKDESFALKKEVAVHLHNGSHMQKNIQMEIIDWVDWSVWY